MGSGQRWAIIANPVAGRGKGRRLATELERLLARSGVEASLLWTTRSGEAERLAADAVGKGTDGVLVCGGDGTVHEVVNGLMGAAEHPEQVSVGIAPAGRCNDLAACLGLPTDLRRIVEAVESGRVRRIDLGRIGERYYATVATLGFDSAVSQYVADGHAPAFLAGTPAYFYALFLQLLRYRDVPVRLRGDSLDFQGHIFLAATGNTPRYGGRMKIAPTAVVDDGLLDLCLVRSVSRLEVLKMVPRIFSGGHVHHPAVSLHRVRRLSIESLEPLWLWADGERVAQTPATIEVVPKALSVLSPV
ncbi:MAG: diacylglycerol kinase family protein [Dehalococcoidia bacterium]